MASGPSRSQSPWLDSEQQQAWLAVIRMVMRLPAALEAALHRHTGRSMFEYMVLSQLSEVPDRTLRMSALAERANSSLSRLSHVVGRMEKRDWVVRRQCVDDGRATEAVLTEAGWAKLAESAPLHVAAVRAMVIEAMSPAQLKQTAAGAERISKAINKALVDDPTGGRLFEGRD